MPSNALNATRLRQLLWIASGVMVLTVLVIFVSWLASGGAGNEQQGQRGRMTTTDTAARPTFQPESPQAGPPRDAPAALLPMSPTTTSPVIPSAQPPQGEGVPVQGTGDTAAAVSQDHGALPATVPEPETPLANPETQASPSKPAPPSQTALQGFGVQLGAFSEAANVKDLETRLKAQGYRVALLPKGKVTRVIVLGPKSRAEAETLLDALKRKGFPQAAVVTLP